MDAELITIGDEIITGHITDTNSAYMARQLTAIGVNVRYKTSVGDSLVDMEEAFRLALKRSSLVIATGGLGPTDDDITKRAIVKVFKRNLIFHEDVLEEIKARYVKRGIQMPGINQNQALLPQGAKFFPNKHGSAVGICIAEQGRIFISLPGVPREMQQILTDEVIPYVKSLKTNRHTHVVNLHTTGIIEAKSAELITPGLRLEAGVKLAYLPSYSGVHLRIIVISDNKSEAEEKARALVAHLESVCGKYIYGRENDTLEGIVGQLLIDNDKTLSVAESCTGGQLGMLVTSVPGSSSYFLGGVIAYANDVKIDKLKVPADIIETHGAVSEECAIAMAQGCRKMFGSSYALSVTGIAGPDGGTEEKPVGTVYMGLASAHAARARKFIFGSDREVNRTRAVYAAIEMLRREILDIE
jgi:nicotinamide-nucleotide amidase